MKASDFFGYSAGGFYRREDWKGISKKVREPKRNGTKSWALVN